MRTKVRDIRNNHLDVKSDPDKLKVWYEQALPEALQKLEKQVPPSPGPFTVGGRISYADVTL